MTTPGTPAIAEAYALIYFAGWGGAHLGLAIGSAALACAALIAGCATAAISSPIVIQGFARGGPEWHIGLETVKNMNIVHVGNHIQYGILLLLVLFVHTQLIFIYILKKLFRSFVYGSHKV